MGDLPFISKEIKLGFNKKKVMSKNRCFNYQKFGYWKKDYKFFNYQLKKVKLEDILKYEQ